MPIASPIIQGKALDACYGDGHAANWPGTVYIGFLSADPRAGGVEPSAGGYARIAVANTSANFPNANTSGASAIKSNALELVTPPSTAAWGTDCTWFAIYDAATGGNAGDCGQLNATVSVPAANYTARFQVGTLQLSVV
jgi:hypothetical protein